MPYLTKVPEHILFRTDNHSHFAVQRVVHDPGARHRAVMALFGQLSDRARADAKILYRVDHSTKESPSVLVQSSVKPENLPSGALMKEFDFPDLQPGTPVQFRLAVNAVSRLVAGGTRPIPLDDSESEDETLSPWLTRKLSPGLKEIEIVNHRRSVLKGPKKHQGKPTAVQVDLIDGAAVVDSPEDLRRLLENGVGRAKSYGCGLLSIRPLTANVL